MNSSIYYFNPGHEVALKNASPYYTPPTNMKILQDDLAYLYAWYGSKNDYVLVSKMIIEQIPLIRKDILPIFFDSLEDIEDYVGKTNYKLLAKAPYSSSGKGLLWLPIGKLNRTEKQIMHGILKKQDSISIERALNKIIDFAMEFNISDTKKCSFTAYSLFQTNDKGNYSNNYIGSQDKIISKLSNYTSIEQLIEIQKIIQNFIEKNFGGVYCGSIGVDMMIYEENEKYYLQPCIEINVRDNMGLISYAIASKYIEPNSEGYFFIDYKKELGKQKEEDQLMSQKFPLIVNQNKIESGYLSLCPIYSETKYRAYILVNSI